MQSTGSDIISYLKVGQSVCNISKISMIGTWFVIYVHIQTQSSANNTQ